MNNIRIIKQIGDTSDKPYRILKPDEDGNYRIRRHTSVKGVYNFLRNLVIEQRGKIGDLEMISVLKDNNLPVTFDEEVIDDIGEYINRRRKQFINQK